MDELRQQMIDAVIAALVDDIASGYRAPIAAAAVDAVLPLIQAEREKWMREGAEKAAQAIERANAEINDAVGRSADWLTDAARLAREAVPKGTQS